MADIKIGVIADTHDDEGSAITITAAARAWMVTQSPNVIIHLGDLFDDAVAAQAADPDNITNFLDAVCGEGVGGDAVPTIAIPGNHDCYSVDLTKATLLGLLEARGTFLQDGDGGVTIHDTFEGYYDVGNVRVIWIDANYSYTGGEYVSYDVAGGWQGYANTYVQPDSLTWLDGVLTTADAAGKFSVVVLHQSAGNRTINNTTDRFNYYVLNMFDLIEVVEAHQVALVMHGHTHSPQREWVGVASHGLPLGIIAQRRPTFDGATNGASIITIDDATGRWGQVEWDGTSEEVKQLVTVWNGDGGDAKYSTADNWEDNAAPAGNEWAVFPAGTKNCTLDTYNSSSPGPAQVIETIDYDGTLTITAGTRFHAEAFVLGASAILAGFNARNLGLGGLEEGSPMFAGSGTVNSNVTIQIRYPRYHWWTFTGTCSGQVNIDLSQDTGTATRQNVPIVAGDVTFGSLIFTPNNNLTDRTAGDLMGAVEFRGRVTVGDITIEPTGAGDTAKVEFLGGLTCSGDIALGKVGTASLGYVMFGGDALHSVSGDIDRAGTTAGQKVEVGGRLYLGGTFDGTDITVTQSGEGEIDGQGVGEMANVAVTGNRLIARHMVASGVRLYGWNQNGCTGAMFKGRKVIGMPGVN